MAVKVLIKRRCPKDNERELFRLIKEARRMVPLQPGYISSEYLKSIGDSSEITAISSWYTLEDWQAWFESEERKEIQSKIDACNSVPCRLRLPL